MIVGRESPNAGLRIPKVMIKVLDIEARKNGRSRNSEMAMRIERTMQEDGLIAKAPSVVNG